MKKGKNYIFLISQFSENPHLKGEISFSNRRSSNPWLPPIFWAQDGHILPFSLIFELQEEPKIKVSPDLYLLV